jgi:hypothetical protein
VNRILTLQAQPITNLKQLHAAYRGREDDLAKTMRRAPIIPTAPTIDYEKALLAAVLPSAAQIILKPNFNSFFTASKIIYTANIINAFFQASDFAGRSVLELGPGQFAFALLARSLGSDVTTLDKNAFFVDCAKVLDFPIYHLDYYQCLASDVPARFDGLWLKGSFSALLPGGERAIREVAAKLSSWIAPGGWGFVAPNNKEEKYHRKFGEAYVDEMHRLIEAQRAAMESAGWRPIVLTPTRRRYFGLASTAYNASRYLFIRNLDDTRLATLP